MSITILELIVAIAVPTIGGAFALSSILIAQVRAAGRQEERDARQLDAVHSNTEAIDRLSQVVSEAAVESASHRAHVLARLDGHDVEHANHREAIVELMSGKGCHHPKKSA